MHQRVRCPECHYWTDALLIWAAGDCCPRCNAPIGLGGPADRLSGVDAPGPRGTAGRGPAGPWRPPTGLGSPSRQGERQL